MYPANYYYSYPHHAVDARPKEMIPSHMPPSPLYQPWPYAHNYSYPVPHGCCSAPYAFQPPNPFHPPFPGTYHVPPPHYSVEQPRHDYDKNNHHCCGCNHPPRIRDESQVDDKKTSNDSSLVPLLLKDRPEYPIMLVPRGYITNTEPEAKEKEMHSHDPVSVKPLEPSKQGGNGEMPCDPEYPILWVPRGYMTNTVSEAKDKEKHSHEPVSVNHIEPSRRGEMAQDEKNEDGNRLPFKIFWLPSKNDQVGNDASHDLVAKKGLPDDKIIKKNNKASGGEGECETSKKHVVQKVIPVKQASTKEEKKNPKSIETKVNTGSVEKSEDGSRASPKASKLPPVCLRVDPLPRKKKSSRSPSPTAEKQRSNGSPINTPKSSQQGDDNFTNNVATGKRDESEKGKVEEKKRSLSEDEAALIIQSVYRGFEVRKSQPLKKLRQIYEVKKQVLELRNCIQELETSSSANHIDGKKEVIIGETIMSLLLKLDTIQGLHPFVREARKSVAKELVGLQKRLDSLVKSEIPSDQQIMHREDEKPDQAQTQSGMCENHEEKSTESHCHDSICEPQLELHKEKLNQAPTPTECDETHEVEALESRKGCNELQLELHKEKLDQAPTECDETHEVEALESRKSCIELQLELHKEKLDQALGECNEALETRATESQVESHKEEKPTECDKALELCEKPTECEEALKLCEKPTECDDVMELCEKPAECDDALESCEKPVECDDALESFEKPTECDEALESCEKPAALESCVKPAECVEAVGLCEKPAECDDALESCEKPATECDDALEPCEKTDNGVAEADDMKHELSGDADNTSIMEMKSAAKANEGSDGTNEKARMAMEELINEQLSVIRELTERVKDLEKKLSKKQKKKIKVNKCRRSRDYVVEQEDCLV